MRPHNWGGNHVSTNFLFSVRYNAIQRGLNPNSGKNIQLYWLKECAYHNFQQHFDQNVKYKCKIYSKHCFYLVNLYFSCTFSMGSYITVRLPSIQNRQVLTEQIPPQQQPLDNGELCIIPIKFLVKGKGPEKNPCVNCDIDLCNTSLSQYTNTIAWYIIKIQLGSEDWGAMAKTWIRYMCTVTLTSKIWPWVKFMTNPFIKDNKCVNYYPDLAWQWECMAWTQILCICALWPWPWR